MNEHGRHNERSGAIINPATHFEKAMKIMDDQPIYSITNWNEHFENSQSRRYENTQWVPVPNRFDGDRVSELIERGGAATYGAWCAALLIASRCKPRGTLIRSTGTPMTPKTLQRATGIGEIYFAGMFEIAINVGLINTHGVPNTPGTVQGVFPPHDERKKERKKRKHDETASGSAGCVPSNDSIGEPEPDPIRGAIILKFRKGREPQTKAERVSLAALVRDFTTKLDGKPATFIARVIRAYKKEFPNSAITAHAVLKHWDSIAPDDKPQAKPAPPKPAFKKLTKKQQAEATKMRRESIAKHFKGKGGNRDTGTAGEQTNA